jgi:hypothetical protein
MGVVLFLVLTGVVVALLAVGGLLVAVLGARKARRARRSRSS